MVSASTSGTDRATWSTRVRRCWTACTAVYGSFTAGEMALMAMSTSNRIARSTSMSNGRSSARSTRRATASSTAARSDPSSAVDDRSSAYTSPAATQSPRHRVTSTRTPASSSVWRGPGVTVTPRRYPLRGAVSVATGTVEGSMPADDVPPPTTVSSIVPTSATPRRVITSITFSMRID